MRARALVQMLFAVGWLCGCASKLDRPERFAATVQKFGGSAGAAGKKASTAGAGAGGGAGAGAGSGASAGAGASADAGKPAPPACVLQIFKTTCGAVGCHAKGSPQIDLASDGVAGRLIDQKSTSMVCKGRVYVATSTGASLLLDKLSKMPPCGAQMPLGATISATNSKCLSDWVQSLGGSVPDAGAM